MNTSPRIQFTAEMLRYPAEVPFPAKTVHDPHTQTVWSSDGGYEVSGHVEVKSVR